MKQSRLFRWAAVTALAFAGAPAFADPVLGTYIQAADGSTRNMIGIQLIANGGTAGTYIEQATNNTKSIVGVSLIDGSGNILTTGCQIATPCKAGSLAINDATIGSDALAVTGTASFSGLVSSNSSGFQGSNLIANSNLFIGGGLDLLLTHKAAATLHLGAPDAAAPVAQTLGVQGVVTGTSNTAGANWTLAGSQGTGTGAGGSLIFQVAPAGTTGTAQNALVTALTLDSTKTLNVVGNIISGGQISASTTGAIFWAGRSTLFSPSDGIITLGNNASTSFTRLQFGGTGPSFPALERNGTGLAVKVADSSGYSTLEVGRLISYGVVNTQSTTVSGLAAAATAGAGARSFVTDGTAPVFGNTVTGGGAVPTPVYSDGTAWRVGENDNDPTKAAA
jgi:hypothetical protein